MGGRSTSSGSDSDMVAYLANACQYCDAGHRVTSHVADRCGDVVPYLDSSFISDATAAKPPFLFYTLNTNKARSNQDHIASG